MASANAGNGDDSESTLSLDAILDVLGHHHRRTLFRWIRTQPDQQVTEEEIVEHLLDQERERTGQTPSPDHIRITLHHVHEPKLSETGLITYDEATQEYEYHQNDRLEKWLDLIESEHESEW